jgi:hypothetical protein
MKKILALGTFIIFAASCKKKEITTTPVTIPPPAEYVYVTTPGSYWIYDWYQVDSLGNETMMNWKDTVRIEGDTTIDSKIYQVLKKTGTGFLEVPSFQRDSLGWIVGTAGIIYSYVGSPMLLGSSTDGYYDYVGHIGEDQDINTNFGIMHAASTYLSVSKTDGSPLNNCGDYIVDYYKHYVSGIGLMQQEIEYFSLQESMCSKKRAKLRSYYIAP